MPVSWMFVVLGCGLVCLFFGFRYRKKVALIDGLPTSPVESVFIGLVELKGTAESENPLRSYLAESRCVQYRYKIEEHWRKTEQVTVRDSNGNTSTRTRTTTGWTTVASGGDMSMFYLRDESGVIRVNPQGATLHPAGLFQQSAGRSNPIYYGKGPRHSISNSTHRRRFTEEGIPLHHPIYLVGKARERADIVAPEITHDAEARLFLISTKSEEAVRRGFVTGYWGLTLLGAALLYIVPAVLLREDPQWATAALGPASMLWGGYFVAWFAGWIISTYNCLVELRLRMRRSWTLVDIQLKRRADLIPNLVAILEAYRDHEVEVQQSLARLRTQGRATEPGTAGPDPEGCTATIRALAEAYPDLKANTQFLNLQSALAETEQRIALARAYANDVSTNYNTSIAVFPQSLVATIFSFKSHVLFAAEDFERPVVAFDLAVD